MSHFETEIRRFLEHDRRRRQEAVKGLERDLFIANMIWARQMFVPVPVRAVPVPPADRQEVAPDVL